MIDYPVIDADGHLLESVDEVRKHLPSRWNGRQKLTPSDGWDRGLRGRLPGQTPQSPFEQLRDMDVDGVDTVVLYTTAFLSLGRIPEPDFAADLAAAYNSWLAEFCQADTRRLKFVALLAPQDAKRATKELHRSVTKLGAVGAMLPTPIALRPDWGHEWWDPLYKEAQTLDVGLGFHAEGASIGHERFHNFIAVHTVDHPMEQMLALCVVVVGGVLERFPTLRLAFLEGGIGWVPFFMDRLDEEVEKRGAVEAPWLKAKPSEYITSGRCYFGAECGEKPISDAVRTTGDDCLLFATDYPHWDGDWPHTVETVRGREDLSETTKRKWLYDNPRRYYSLDL